MALNTLSALNAAITGVNNYSGVNAATKGVNSSLHSRFIGTSSTTGVGLISAGGLAGATRVGSLPWAPGIVPYHPAGGANLSYIVGSDRNCSTSQQLDILCDRLWDNNGIVVTTTTAQTINSVTWPARDANASINGEGVYIALEVSTATTNAANIAGMTIDYTNSAGVAGRTGNIVPTTGFPATAVIGSFALFDLAPGDFGVRSVQSVTLGTTLLTGAVSLVAFRPLQAFQAGFSIQRRRRSGLLKCWKTPLLQGCFPFWVIAPNGGGSGLFMNNLTIAEG